MVTATGLPSGERVGVLGRNSVIGAVLDQLTLGKRLLQRLDQIEGESTRRSRPMVVQNTARKGDKNACKKCTVKVPSPSHPRCRFVTAALTNMRIVWKESTETRKEPNVFHEVLNRLSRKIRNDYDRRLTIMPSMKIENHHHTRGSPASRRQKR